MAHWTCGFEVADLTYYQEQGWVFTICSIVTTAGRFHTSFASRGGVTSLNIGSAAETPIIGTGGRWLHFWTEGWGGSAGQLGAVFKITSADNASVVFLGNGTIQIRRGSAQVGTLLAVGSFNPQVAHWMAIEANLQTTGQVTVYVDGVQVAQFVGDTANNSDDWDQVEFDPTNSFNRTIDDIIVTTAAEGQLSEFFLPLLLPTGNDVIGSGAGSTGGAGTFANVDELPPDGGTSYNEFTAGGTDRYTAANLGYTPATIHSVTVMNQAARDGTITAAQTVCATDTGGGGPTEALGTSTGLGAAGVYVPWQDTFNVDPNTAAAWTITGLDDLRIGVKFS